MHSPRPYGLLITGGMPTEADQVLIEATVRHLTNLKSTSGVDALRLVRTLPDGGYVIAKDEGGTLRVIVSKDLPYHEIQPDGVEHTYIPMLYSGAINRNILKAEEGTGIKLSHTTRRRLYHYDEKLLAPEQVYLQRFRIEYAPEFAYFKPQRTGIYTYTQFVKHKPTWYSGAMREVMQIVSGYGIQSLDALPDVAEEQATVKIPDEFLEKILQQLQKKKRLPGYTGYPDVEGFFKYDYKANRSHVVAFDSDNQPWLVNIDYMGVHVMPLPIVPATSTEAYREYIESVQDEEILKILDRFGGLPSGEGFPRGEAFYQWQRAGVIIKVCDCADFYRFSSMYMACGWSVNSKGTEGFNTCWEYDSNGLLRVHGYKLKLTLSPAVDQGKLPEVKLSGDEALIISRYLTRLFELLEKGTDKTRAIHYKLRIVPQEDVYQQALTALTALTALHNPLGVTSVDVDYWDNYTAKPIAKHGGNVSRVTSGPAYWGLKSIISMGRLKFPELTGQGCESFIMVSPDYKGPMQRCDTVMFGCYVGDQLQVIKYFMDERKPTHKEESTFETS